MNNPTFLDLEHRLALIMADQERTGFDFDFDRAKIVRQEQADKFEAHKRWLCSRFAGIPGELKIPKVNNRKRGVYKGCPYHMIKEFNPTSRQHIAFVLKRLGVIFDKTTASGQTKIDEGTLTAIRDNGNYSEKAREAAGHFAELLQLQKYLGQLSEGANSWFNTIEKDGCIHHSCTLATQTGRNAHRGPNLGQVVSAPWARQLFIPKSGMTMVGTDLKGLELRCLGHFLAPHDGGAFADVVLNGDIHAQNSERVGCTRNEVKTLTYAFIYGAGDAKLGGSLDPSLTESQKKSLGYNLRRKFLDAIPGLEPLIKAAKLKIKESGQLRGLDGRPIFCTAEHAALNYLLQSAGAVLSKRWVVISYDDLCAEFQPEVDFFNCAYIHDEQQLSVRPQIADRICEIVKAAAIKAGDFYNFRVKIEADTDTGKSWGETH